MITRTPRRALGADKLPRDAQGRLILDIYARMSDGFEGKEINVASQVDVCQRVVQARGAVVGEVLSDPLSAWKRNVVRKGWCELVERMWTGQSAGVVIYHIDRFLRQPRELERLLDTVERMDCVLISGGSERKLDSPDDRFILRIEVAQACKASDDTQRRVRAKLAALRERGVLVGSGPRAFAWPGWEPKKGNERRRRAVSEGRLTAECEALKWAFDEFLAGRRNLTEIAEAWNAEGLFGFYGRPWTNVTVRQVMQRQRHAGRIEHKGVVVSDIADHEPTIDPAVFDQVQMTFASRRRGRPTSKKYLGSGILRCALCEMPMVSRPRYPGGDSSRPAIPTYRCIKSKGGGRCGGVQIDQEPVDAFLRTLTIRRLSDPAVAGKLSEVSMEAAVRGVDIESQLHAARAAEVGISAKLGAGEISYEAYDAAHTGLMQRIRALEAQQAQLAAAAADLGGVRAQSELSVAKEWDAAEPEARRELLLSATRLLRILVRPMRGERPGMRVPPEERIDLRPL